MDKINRKRLGIIFNFHPSWMGGIIYVLNSVRILNYLEDEDKPLVFLFYDPKLEKFVEEIDYPYLEKVPWKFYPVHYGFAFSIFRHKNLFVHDLVIKYNLDAVYPMHNFPVKSKLGAKLVAWIADLQHKYYPEFFTQRKRYERDLRIKFILKNTKDYVMSSQAVLDDFYRFYKIPKHVNFHIYHFVSIIEGLPNVDFDTIRAKYNLPEAYFMISNQFHKHKNHKAAFKALAEVKKQGKNIHFAITGKFPEEPNSEYMHELHNIISEHDLKENISFLGLIPRGDQLLLMKYAQAILQPSLFEGWSTVIEDARSLQVPVIAASLPVNIEQLQELGTYHEPHDFIELAKIIESYPSRDYDKNIYEDYEVRMKEAAYKFMKIFNDKL